MAPGGLYRCRDKFYHETMPMERFAAATNRERENLEKEAFLDVAYEKAMAFLEGEAVDMDEFRGIYPEAEIQRNIAEVVAYEKKFDAETDPRKKRDKKLATIVEAIFLSQAGRNGWLGEGAQVLRSSRYDDYVNGVDCITEYTQGNVAAYLAMAIDATWSVHPGFKFNRIREDLSRGKLGNVKYFKAGGKPQRGREVPKVVVGASEETLSEVIKLWMSGDVEALKNHPIQILFLEEIVEQLEGFRTFSEYRKHQKNVKIFDEYLAILRPILEEKKKMIQPEKSYEHDIVRTGIQASLVGLNYRRPLAA